MGRGAIPVIRGLLSKRRREVDELQRQVGLLWAKTQEQATQIAALGIGAGRLLDYGFEADLQLVQVTTKVSGGNYKAKRIVFVPGFDAVMIDPEDDAEFDILAAPGEGQLFVGCRGISIFLGQYVGTSNLIHMMIASEGGGIDATLSGPAAPIAGQDIYYNWRQSPGFWEAGQDHSSTTLGAAKDINGLAYDTFNVTATRMRHPNEGTRVKLHWNETDDRFWFAGGTDPDHGPCADS